jgi:hypothetical protein
VSRQDATKSLPDSSMIVLTSRACISPEWF